MTVSPSTGSEVAQYGGDEGTLGLDDVGVGDVILPRLTIIHDEAKFKDNLSNATFDSLDCIMLGLVKQRVLWASDVDDGDKPMCKSPDFEHGFPNVSDDTKKDKRFPWERSNFDPADFPPGAGINGLVTLPCAACHFKEWDKNGFDQKVPPCTEQHSYPLLYNAGEAGDPIWTAAVLTFQKTGIKPSRQYLSSFAQSRTPMFTVVTRITLTPQSKGSVKYAVPVLRRGEATDADLWPGFGDQYRQIREYLRAAPRPLEDEDFVPGDGFETSNANTPAPAATAPSPPAPQQAAPAAAPASPPAAATPAPGGDDLPF